MTVGQDLMKKYPIGVSERIAKEIDDAILQVVTIERHLAEKWRMVYLLVGLILGVLSAKFLV